MKPSTGCSSSEGRRFSMCNFSPIGLHILVVDDDPLCLMVLDRMLRHCNYKVTTCNRVNRALELLRENKEDFDLVMSDVYMPDVDGFKLLEIIGLELDLPVIMMSANGETSVVMKGITHGACDYLIKPVRMEELRNIWQHVIRRKGKDSPSTDDSGKSAESQEQSSKKRKEVVESVDDMVDDISSLKKARVNWSVQLHQQFVSAVNQLGVDKAVPKKILEIMSVQGLTRENVASHLQKYRLYLKRLSGVVPEPCPIASFQASDDGTGGTMLIQPGGKNSASTSAIKGLNLGAGISPGSTAGRAIDPGTMNALAQFKSSQQKLAANRAQVLGGLGLVDEQRPFGPGGLQRMASLDLSFFMQAQQTDLAAGRSVAADVLDDLASQSLKSVKLEDGGVEVSKSSQRRQAVTDGLIARWNINPGLNPRDGKSDEANVTTPITKSSHRLVNMEAYKESRQATEGIEIADDMSSTDLPHALSPSSATELSGDGFSESSFTALGDLSLMASASQLIPSSVLDVSDYLLDDVFSYRN